MFTTILLFAAILSILVFVHELGHFLVARKMGMKVDEFGFGFPPRAWGVKRGGTLYSLNWIPMGGFVKIKGESGEDRHAPDSFASKGKLARFAVLFAGVAMNFVAACVLLTLGFMAGMPTVIDGPLPAGAQVRDRDVRVMSVYPGSPAARAGVAPGDVLVSLDAAPFTESQAARDYIGAHGASGVDVVLRPASGADRALRLVAEPLGDTGRTGFGVGLVDTGTVSLPIHRAVLHGVASATALVRDIVVAFADLAASVFTRKPVDAGLTGPVGIAVMTGDAAALGLGSLLQFMAVLSANLAVVNLLPFPALDGGRILFLIIEAIRRKPADEKVETAVHNAGFLILLLLILLVTFRDFMQFGGRMIDGIKNLVGA